ncbi:hypothetical protein Taro_051816 [Colocasia esculenta]|uniref:Uncharacterized protein n=1 Tax=Colocasia esculenta TaxID=4460 RepID=A0A843XGV6_COLES|nr:hypothetical protein [Colocasia esculenta]
MQISCKGSVDIRSSGVDTGLQTQDKIMQNWSSSVDTSLGSVDTRDSSQNTFWPIWDSVSTLGLPRTPSGLFWDSVSTLAQEVSTLVPFQNKTYRSCGTRKHISCSGLLTPLITL